MAECGALMAAHDTRGRYGLRCILEKDHEWPVHEGAWVRHPDFPEGLEDPIAKAIAHLDEAEHLRLADAAWGISHG